MLSNHIDCTAGSGWYEGLRPAWSLATHTDPYNESAELMCILTAVNTTVAFLMSTLLLSLMLWREVHWFKSHVAERAKEVQRP
ncbi:hypothetical protein CALCODRAFT_500639 [Calocera cornea HHB12733]|uniref:Copper transporter n=1 Tax=Calocera cornea HHB12733 TaxID=1353952 RepID=A0A165DYC1_9BASI|nr:hypothetical protein CALCODRAFT_500639 [Calocera cornea HHB12733]